MPRKTYPSDISREQFEMIRPLLESARMKTNKRTYDLYDIFCGLLYVLTTGCQWAALPSDYPDYNLVYYYYGVWKEPRGEQQDQPSLLEEILKKIGFRRPSRPWSLAITELGHS